MSGDIDLRKETGTARRNGGWRESGRVTIFRDNAPNGVIRCSIS